MADLKISQLSDGGNSQATDEYVIARSGANYRIDGASIAAAATSVGTLSSLTVSGDLTVDTSTLKVDSANNRVGIGTASPSTPLHVTTSANAAPIRMDNQATGAQGYFDLTAGATTMGALYRPASSDNIRIDANFGSFIIGTGAGTASPRVTIDNSGNLGIGVTPSYKLHVAGDAKITSDTYFGTHDGAKKYYFERFGSGAPNAYLTSGSADNNSRQGFIFQARNSDGVEYNAFILEGYSSTSTDTAMTLDASGNLGVGTASPGSVLDVQTANAGSGFRLTSTTGTNGVSSRFSNTAGDLYYGIDTSAGGTFGKANAAVIWYTAAQPLVFATNNAEKARITSGGYFKASNTGTYENSAGAYHELRTDANDTLCFAKATSAAYSSNGFTVEIGTAAGTGFNILTCNNSGGNAFIVRGNGNALNTNGSYGTISDIKHKQDVIDAPSQWDDLKAVRFRKFRMKADVAANPDAPYMLGVVAQELEQVSPGLVEDAPDYEKQEVTDEDGNVTTERVQVGTTKSVKSSILLMKAAVALQEAMARIEALEVEVAALKASA